MTEPPALRTAADFQRRAAEVYAQYVTPFKARFKWLRSDLFRQTLAQDLRRDAQALLRVLQKSGEWDANRDAKLDALHRLLQDPRIICSMGLAGEG